MALPPETARMLIALEAFLDAPPLSCDFRCIRCHNYVAFDNNFIQHNYRFVIHEGQFVLLVCGDGAGIEAVFPM
ncbi:hypothetical protein PVL29_019521 [Vitis rotundifolia]|uniref:Yippee domain-containing protein n=1 Tax=Vitis rotundifolia TaxID=103349 RepID=A0AA38Z0R3_VITRO|nr:hypothetical protein PVL29_019521 [Vitis rotundifolia]